MLDVPHQILLHQLPPLRQLVGVEGDHGERAGAEYDVGDLGERGARVLDPGAEAAKHSHGLMSNAAHLIVHGYQPIQIRRPGHLPAFDRGRLHRADELTRIDLIGKRGAFVGAGDRGEHESSVSHGTRQRSSDSEGVPNQNAGMLRDEPWCGAEPDDAAESRRRPEGSAQIRPLGDRTHSGGHGHRGASARPPARQGGVPRVACGAEHRVERSATGAELRCVRLAHHDGSGRLETLHHEVVFGRHVMLVDQRAPCRANALGRRQVLDRNRHAVKRGQHGALSIERPGRRAGRGERRFAGDRDVGVDCGIDRIDSGQHRLHDLER